MLYHNRSMCICHTFSFLLLWHQNICKSDTYSSSLAMSVPCQDFHGRHACEEMSLHCHHFQSLSPFSRNARTNRICTSLSKTAFTITHHSSKERYTYYIYIPATEWKRWHCYSDVHNCLLENQKTYIASQRTKNLASWVVLSPDIQQPFVCQ